MTQCTSKPYGLIATTKFIAVSLLTLLGVTSSFTTNLVSASEANPSPNKVLQRPAPWKTLRPSLFLDLKKQVPFYELQTENGCALCLVIASINNSALKFVPFFNNKTATTGSAARRYRALVAINGGYFNLSDGQSASYVFVDGHQLCDPRENKALIGNPKLKSHLEAIFNRSELRVLKNQAGKIRIDICRHNEAPPAGWSLFSSLQAGPQLLPTLTAEQEAFVRVNPDGTSADSIGTQRPAARTACGVTRDGQIMLLCIAGAGQEEFSSGVTLAELANILKQLGCDRAINFDGGTSTSMTIGCQGEPDPCKQVCGKVPEKQVKSGFIITAGSP